MRKITYLLLLAGFLAATACAPGVLDDPVAAEWREVLVAKKEWQHAAPNESVRAQQAYVDRLAGFVRRHPDHARGRIVYEEAELEFARALARRGEFDRAVRYYRSILLTNPDHEEARAELRAAERRRFVSPESLAALRIGMSPDQVRATLGSPLPGWSRSMRRGDSVVDSWYYPRRGGGVAGVFFRNEKLFAAECGAPVRLSS